MAEHRSVLIVGAGSGLSASLARACHADGMRVVLAARNTSKLGDLATSLDAHAIACDASDANDVAALFDAVDERIATPDLVLYNPSRRVRGGIAELDPDAVREALMVTAFGAFLVAREAARRMLARGSGSIFFTGASASVKGYANSSTFAMGKFALRGLSQSMARELGPKNIHVAHFVIDGSIGPPEGAADRADARRLDPDAIAQTYLHVHRQPRSAWTEELALRPCVEPF